MDILIKSKVGPTAFRYRKRTQFGFENKEFEFSLDNDCRCVVPEEVWNDVENNQFDRDSKFKEIFTKL